MFRHPSRLNRTIPLALHGDEGRYLKRSNFLVLTVESVLGVQRPRRQPCDCKSDPCLERYGDLHGLEGPAQRKASKQECNAKGHPYLSKFLCCGMSSSQYKEHPELLDSILELLSADLRKFCIEGIDIPGHGRLYGGFLGLKGDMAFHHKVGQLSRSYYNLGKRSDIPICHLCLAGAPNVAFETVSDTPDWEGSYCMSEPWESPPALASVPFDPLRKAEIFRLDPFHLWRVGLGRDLVGSGIVCLCQLGYMDLEPGCSKNIDDRLVRAHALFKLWCAGAGRTPALRSFSVHNFNCKSRSKYPWANVKGSDCTLMTDWLLFFTRNQIGDVKPEHQSFISALQQTLASAVAFWSILHSHGLWLDRYCAQRLQHKLSTMLRGYKSCAQHCYSFRLAGFSLKPKLHGLHHLSVSLLRDLRGGAAQVMSPLVFNCESNEDLIGKVARLARRCDARLVNSRVFDRLMVKTKALLKQGGY